MAHTESDRQEIVKLIEDWVIWRDAGQWEKLLTVWHSDGRINTTWFSGPAEQFIRASAEAWANGMSVSHFLGGTSVDVSSDRAIAQTKMSISQRAQVQGVICDCVCTGRFYDFFEKRSGVWGLIMRQPIYETDRIDPLYALDKLKLDIARLSEFPEGYKHLAFLQTSVGMHVKKNLPGTRGPRVEALYRIGARWLEKHFRSNDELFEAFEQFLRADD